MEKHEVVAKKFPPESAGRLMTDAVPVVATSATIGDIESLLLKEKGVFESINYIYLVDSRHKLRGVVSVKDVFHQPKSALVGDVATMDKRIVSVRGRTDRERVALLALKHNIKAIPVVDKDGVFLGAVPSDVILSILNSETIEDILRFGGVVHSGAYENALKIPLSTSVLHRLPWLLIGLLGGVLVAGVISAFEETLSQNLVLAGFIPLVVYMGSAVGVQTQAFIIRDLTFGTSFSFLQYFVRQSFIAAVVGVVIGFLFYVVGFAWYGDSVLALVVGAALFIAVLSSVLTGLAVPYLFSRMHFDPANASGPIVTILQDILSVVIYFSVATLFL